MIKFFKFKKEKELKALDIADNLKDNSNLLTEENVLKIWNHI